LFQAILSNEHVEAAGQAQFNKKATFARSSWLRSGIHGTITRIILILAASGPPLSRRSDLFQTNRSNEHVEAAGQAQFNKKATLPQE